MAKKMTHIKHDPLCHGPKCKDMGKDKESKAHEKMKGYKKEDMKEKMKRE